MRYTIKCNKCGKAFAAETKTFGQQKYRCPYCNQVMTCEFNPPKTFWTKARSIQPVLGTLPTDSYGKALPIVVSKLITPSDTLSEMGDKMVNVGKESGKKLHSTIDWILDHITIFLVFPSHVYGVLEQNTQMPICGFFLVSVLSLYYLYLPDYL